MGLCGRESVGVTATWFYVWCKGRMELGTLMEPQMKTGAGREKTRKPKDQGKERKESDQAGSSGEDKEADGMVGRRRGK